MQDCKPTTTPMVPNYQPQSNDEYQPTDLKTYQKIIGSLVYISTITRPDITFAVHHLSTFLSNPQNIHLIAAKRILRYLKGTINHTIIINKCDLNVFNIQIYNDADFGGDSATGKSTSGTIVTFNNNPISWKSDKQKCVTISTMESELVAMTQAMKETLWLLNICEELSIKHSTVTIFKDNQSTIKFLENDSTYHPRTKHINIKYHFIKEQIKKYNINIEYSPTNDMLADFLTKPLSKVKLLSFVQPFLH